MIHLPANLSVSSAKLPQVYQAAKTALATCEKLDECVDWSNKAEALASYARQADDDELENYARRIKARAARRCGELLKTFNSPGGRPGKTTVGAHGSYVPSQNDIARQVGLSEHQQLQSVRIANIPEAKFEAAVESEKPPTITKLANEGKKDRPQVRIVGDGPEYAHFTLNAKTMGSLEDFVRWCNGVDPVDTAKKIVPHNVSDARRLVHVMDRWLDQFVVNLPKG